jgi:protoporphyrinogen oxidase
VIRRASVLILGGGFAGLAAALRLARHDVGSLILDAEPAAGGLAGCCEIDGVSIERLYHHIKPEDRHLIDLATELGLGGRIQWRDTRMGFYVAGRFHPFSTPLDLLRFSPLPFLDRIRFGLGVQRARRVDGRSLEGLDAETWVLRVFGRNAYERIMKPMLLNKFGIPPDRISAGFFQGRIKGLSSSKTDRRRGEQLGYLQGGLQQMVGRIEAELRGRSEILPAAPVERIESGPGGFRVWSGSREFAAPYIVNTLPLSVLSALPRNFGFVTRVEYQAVICAIFALRDDPTPLYWTNVLDPAISFRVVVNQARLDPRSHAIVYCANYLRPDDPFFRQPDGVVLQAYERDLTRLFGPVSVIGRSISRERFATPVFDRDFAANTAHLDQAIPGMVFAGNVKVYPYSRTVSSVIGAGYSAADRILALLGRTPAVEAAHA